MDGCLDDNDVQAFFRGRLSAVRTTALQRHVDECSACRYLVAEVARTTDENARPEAGTFRGDTESPSIAGAAVERVVIRDGKVSRRLATANPSTANPSTANPSTANPSTANPSSPPTSRGAAKRGLDAGSVIADRYRLERVLGEGGTGIVWEATHVAMRRRVALKILKSKDPQAIRRFFREARVTAALRHPHIVEVHDVFTVPETGSAAMVMELLDGHPLLKWTRPPYQPEQKSFRSNALSLQRTARVLLPVIAALGAAHAVGVVHRDLKPENIFLVGKEPSLDEPKVKVLDFGLAKLTATEGDVMSTGCLTRSGFVLGTPHYMSPEQVSGDVDIDARTDIWSLGVVLYECLARARPLEAENLSHLLRAVLEAKIVPLGKRVADLPKPIAIITMRMLCRPPNDRPSLIEIHDLLSAYA